MRKLAKYYNLAEFQQITVTVQKQAETIEKKKKVKCLIKACQTHIVTTGNIPVVCELWVGRERDMKAGGQPQRELWTTQKQLFPLQGS